MKAHRTLRNLIIYLGLALFAPATANSAALSCASVFSIEDPILNLIAKLHPNGYMGSSTLENQIEIRELGQLLRENLSRQEQMQRMCAFRSNPTTDSGGMTTT